MRICILGAGSLGCVFGAHLTEGGHDVVLVNRSAVLVEHLNRHGLTLHTKSGDRTVRVKAAVDCRALGPVDLVILLVKSFHTNEALQSALNAIGAKTAVLSLQNGLGHEEIIAAVAGKDKVLIGKTYVGGTMTAPGHVIAGTEGRPTTIGEPDGSLSRRVQLLAAAFSKAGLETTASDDIMAVAWDKLLVNVATGALSAITRLPYGELYAVPEIADCARAAVGEAMAVARAAGIRLSIDDPDKAWRMAGETLPPDFKASMLQSIEKRSITEVDFINGAVVRWGERLGVATPVNRTLVAAVKGVERAIRRESLGRPVSIPRPG